MKALKTLKSLIVLFALSLLLGNMNLNAQENKDEECNIQYTLFRTDFKSKNYDKAFTSWLWTFENCPTLSVNIYKNGLTLAEKRYENAAEGAEKEAAIELVERIYLQRLEYFPDDSPGKMYSEYAMFMDDVNAPESKVFELIQKAYEIEPESLGIKAIFKYFEGTIERNKDTNIQAIFDMNDNLVDVTNNKIDEFSKEVDKLRELEESGQELTKRQAYLKKAYSTNLVGLGKVEDGLGDMLEEYATCERLIPLYEKEFEENSNNAVWLKRSVSRLYNKECTEGEFYDTMVEKYVNADPSSDAFVFYAGMQMKKGNEEKALEYFKKAVDLETDSYKKAKYLYNIAKMMKDKGRFGEARSYAYRALEARPSEGRAYLLIAAMYAASAQNCGNKPIETRMVYQAALVKAKRAQAVDPSISSTAQKHINSYASKAPTTEDIFTEGWQSGSNYHIDCWINENVKIP
jgi:tetratricopeptide (TPR) repeat protein